MCVELFQQNLEASVTLFLEDKIMMVNNLAVNCLQFESLSLPRISVTLIRAPFAGLVFIGETE